jgi:predicted O-methyltransferase YrrM
MSESLLERQRVVADVLADPPNVHISPTAVSGVWSTSETCYRFMAEHVGAGRTLETGLGVSTVLFAKWGCRHTCVVYDQDEVDRLTAYLKRREIPADGLDFRVGTSDQVLPRLNCRDIDLMLIDGRHGWPTAIIDWYYGAAGLVSGGIVVIDDTKLRQVSLGLIRYLDRDPRWERLERRNKWSAYRRLTVGSLSEEWREQMFLGAPLGIRYGHRVPAAMQPALRRAKHLLTRS